MKNKKIVFATLFFLIAIVVIVIRILMLQPKKVEKFTSIKIVDSYGTEILNYDSNKMPFTIETSNNEIIKINGEDYQSGQRIYKPGTYKIEVIGNNIKEKSVVKINEIVRNREHEYSIYLTNETLEALFASLEVSKNKEQKGYFWTRMTSTVNIDNLNKNISNLYMSKYNGETDSKKFKEEILTEVKEYVKSVMQEDEDAYFHLYTEDVNFYIELEVFGKIGLDDSRYDVTLYTNGTLSYVRDFEIYRTNKYERFTEEKVDYLSRVENIKKNMEDYNEYPGSYLVDSKSKVFNNNINNDYMLISTLLRNNIKYEMQYPDKIQFEDEKIAKEMQNAKIVKATAQEKYNELDDDAKKIFFEIINLNKEELDKEYFTNENGNYLIITGTVPIYEKKTQQEFERIIKEVCDDYQDEYTILYKPHPRAIPTEEEEKIFNELNIKVLPGAIPMEAIMFIYPNLKIGGFASSLYMSADEGKTEFFFAEKAEDLVSPINELYYTLFNDAKFYN